MNLSSQEQERFWSRINKDGPMHPYDPTLGRCWLWLGSTDKRGYGLISFHNKPYRVPRISIMLSTGQMPCPEHDACHSCDTPRCANPNHLTSCTRSENMLDASNKGRIKSWKQKLEPPQVLAIRDDPRMHKIIAYDYGLDASTVSKIKSRKIWRRL